MMHDANAGRCNCGACRADRELSRLLRIERYALRYLDALDTFATHLDAKPYEEALREFREAVGAAE